MSRTVKCDPPMMSSDECDDASSVSHMICDKNKKRMATQTTAMYTLGVTESFTYLQVAGCLLHSEENK